MSSSTELWLVRHGQTEWSKSGQHTGRTDLPLLEEGVEQAKTLQPALRGVAFDQVLSSPLGRAKHTCELAGLSEHMLVDPQLLEWDYGIYEGRKTSDIREEVPGWDVFKSPIPEGESREDVQKRVAAFVEELDQQGGRIALFAHAHILRCIAGYWATGDIGFGAHLALSPASMSVLTYHREDRVIKKWNVTHH
ncbi:histidine phosphatase family protein [Carnimonas bestiolae]|uniref:histidine phosphatase family protein n=1 Tax=Carnimonas bestiolae TaxID=3402172 RepID=UPI003EDB8715